MTIARDEINTSFGLIEASQSISRAYETLSKLDLIYGVVINSKGGIIKLVTVEYIKALRDKQFSLNADPSTPVIVINAWITLDKTIISNIAQTMLEYNELCGVIVENDERVIGIVPRETLREYALRFVARQEIDERGLGGEPLTEAIIFICPNKHYKQLLIYYNREEPLLCPICYLPLIKQD